MSDRRPPAHWPWVVLAVMLATMLLGLTALYGRWLGRPRFVPGGLPTRADTAGAARNRLADKEILPVALPGTAADPRLEPLRRAVAEWRQSTGPRRVVVDQVWLVPDVPSFFEAIAAWDEGHFFPILIDEPAWTLPFLRAFRPARVMRYAAAGDRRASPASRLDRWMSAVGAVSRAWASPSRPVDQLSPGGGTPRGLGATPPGLVLSSPDSPMLAGAVALAAGRFQPLIRLEPDTWRLGDSDGGRAWRYGDVLTLSQAWRFARRVEGRVEVSVRRYDRLGDDCDFLTIAGDWPFRYDDDAERGPARGIQALDDLIGRVLEGGPDGWGLNGSRRRWAFTGRLLGDPAASVAHAMGSLFLEPDSALLWDTYSAGAPWSAYTLAPAAYALGKARLVPGAIFYAAGPGAGLANWQRIMDPSNRFGLIWLNSSGGPTQFAIGGGPGRPADVPGGCPAAVVMIHSFSAADPADPRTIAGRWLAQGAFVYFGSVHEPYLQAFRRPGLVAELAAEGVPLSAALRQGESEPFGRPWRLIYLGDPLYRIPGPKRPPTMNAGRLEPESWRKLAPAYADWPVAEVAVPARPAALDDEHQRDDRLLAWCREAAISELTSGHSAAADRPGPDWRTALKAVRRERLDPRLRPVLDDLLIDALSRSGEWDELHARLALIPPVERRPRIWAALETGAMFRLARAARDPDAERGFVRALALWDEVIRLAWPAESGFPAQFIKRVEVMAGSDPHRLESWRDRLRRAVADLGGRSGRFHHAAAVAAARARAESKLRDAH